MENIRIIQLSDLHFGAATTAFHRWQYLFGDTAKFFPRGRSLYEMIRIEDDIWQSLKSYLNETVKPHLVLVTGDIVDTPNEDLFSQAKEKLESLLISGAEKRYLVCPGNHDRHWRGNAPGPLARLRKRVARWETIPAWFDNKFGGVFPRVDNPSDVTLSVGDNKWKLRIIAIDTSADAKYSAQGFMRQHDIDGLVTCMCGPVDTDLVVLMHHHHLLPISELESQTQRLRDLVKPTIMLNAGTVLEKLALGHINMVLHGHEHHPTAMRYGTLRGQQSETVIVGAGSAMGNETLKGSSFLRASLNLIELRPDRSVTLQEIRYKTTDESQQQGVWNQQGNPLILLEGRAIRRARMFRRAETVNPPRSTIATCLGRFG